MLNRRILRLKTLKAVYAYEQALEANYQLALEYIAEAYQPDLNAMTPIPAEELIAGEKAAQTVFKLNYLNEAQQQGENIAEAKPKDLTIAKEAIIYYRNLCQKDKDNYRKYMLEEADELHDRYLQILRLIREMADFHEHSLYEKRHKKQLLESVTFKKELKFVENKLVKKLSENPTLDKLVSDWDKDFVRRAFRKLEQEEFYQKYITKPTEDTPEEEQEFLVELVRDFLFRNEFVQDYFEEHDLNWQENRSILRTLALKTIKALDLEKPQPVEIFELSRNWDEDRIFFDELFTNTIANRLRYSAIIADSLVNWDISRVAFIDKIILLMAVTEMVYFPSIPIKVTINEYIDLAKSLSTPKSREFINGVLNKMSEQLLSTGEIKKSGRGLIDTK
ncbi:MAG: transcription antitermination factor NusB [Bernardetiaceae bacterium]|nr:transcription antitermination factor NusB [Bernardetiaceae bacterium]